MSSLSEEEPLAQERVGKDLPKENYGSTNGSPSSDKRVTWAGIVKGTNKGGISTQETGPSSNLEGPEKGLKGKGSIL